MSEVKRINGECLLEFVFILHPEETKTNDINKRAFSLWPHWLVPNLHTVELNLVFPTHQRAVQSKWTIIHLAGLKTKE